MHNFSQIKVATFFDENFIGFLDVRDVNSASISISRSSLESRIGQNLKLQYRH
jgi:hypothetical protein